MSKQIKFNIKMSVDGKEQLVTATTDTKGLKKAMDGARGSAGSLRDSLQQLANVGNIARNAADGFGELAGKMNELQRNNTAVTQLTGATGAEISQARLL